MVIDSTKLQKDGYGLLYGSDNEILQFEFWDSLDYQQIGDKMTYGSSEVGRFSSSIMQVLMSVPDPDSTTLFIRDVTLDSLGPVTSFSLPVIIDTLLFNDFNWIQVQFGWIDVQIHNDFSFPVDDISISLTNLYDGSLIGSTTFENPIPGRADVAKRMTIDQNLIYNEMLMTMTGIAVGTYRDIFIPREDNLKVMVTLSEIYADSVNGIVPEQNFIAYDTLEYEDANQ